MIQHSEQIDQLAVALAVVQGKVCPARKESTNPHFKNKYADLTSVWDACRDLLSENGLAVVQLPDSEAGDSVTVGCMLVHKSGQWIRTGLTLKPSKADPQGIGSAITYARRYTLASMIGIIADDDDGNAASGSVDAPRQASKGRETPPKEKTAKQEFIRAVAAKTGMLPGDPAFVEKCRELGKRMGTDISKLSPDSDVFLNLATEVASLENV